MPKTVRQVSYNNLKNGHAYTMGEYGQVLVKLGLFSTMEGFRLWHYRTEKIQSDYKKLFFKPLGARGNNRIQTKNIKLVVKMLRGK